MLTVFLIKNLNRYLLSLLRQRYRILLQAPSLRHSDGTAKPLVVGKYMNTNSQEPCVDYIRLFPVARPGDKSIPMFRRPGIEKIENRGMISSCDIQDET